MTNVTTLSFDYAFDGLDCDGVMVSCEDADAPTVLVFHGMEGRSEAQVEFCARLAAEGYRAIAVDLFGRGVSGGDMDAGAVAMDILLRDRNLLRDRLFGVLEIVSALPAVDRDAMAAIGFCFGGLCVLDLARHGSHLRAVGSFHGVLTPPPSVPDEPISTKVAVYHGWEDPFAPPSDVVALTSEPTARGADWQLHAYGHAMHAFMATFLDDPERGMKYDATTARRAWVALVDMLAETFDRWVRRAGAQRPGNWSGGQERSDRGIGPAGRSAATGEFTGGISWAAPAPEPGCDARSSCPSSRGIRGLSRPAAMYRW